MVEEAERHRQEDMQRREEVEARNHADNLIYSAEKALRELGDKVPGHVKSDVEQKVAAVREALNGTDLARIKQRSEELAAAVQQIGASVYEQPGAAPGGEAGSSPGAEPPKSRAGRCGGR
jgi:molecular chaperone DnaK